MSTMFIKGKWLSAALLATFAAAPAGAQQSPAGARHNSYALTLENDSHFDTDRYYTNGIQVAIGRATDQRSQLARAWTGRMCRWLGCDDAQLVASQTNIGQLMYTPTNISMAGPQPLDRPWAGLLYLEQAYAFLAPDGRTLTTLSAEAGLTGRLSLSEPAQKLAHKILGLPAPRGWDNQVGNSPGVMVSAERRSARARLSFDLWRDVRLNTATYWRVGAGNIMTYAAGGVAVVVGKNLPLVSRQPPGIENKLAGARPGASTICVWRWLQCTAFGSVEARAVAYNVFLDGRAWRDDPQVKRRLWVADLSSGVRFDFPNTRSAGHGPWFMQFKITRRSPEFRSSLPARRHIVGAWTIGTEF
jgi:lipid A 3-O-deacylase